MLNVTDLTGRYNKKFVHDWSNKIIKIINKVKANDSSFVADIKTIMPYLDPTKKKEVSLKMREFGKISDGSVFFEEYNSKDWNRIEIPGTSYRTFEQPKPWKKVYI